MNSLLRFISGFVLGALVGVSIALLLAPASGEELREQMKSEADRIQSDVKKAADERRAELEEQLSALRAPRSSEQPPV